LQGEETILRFDKINEIIHHTFLSQSQIPKKDLVNADRFLTHPFWGYVSLVAIMFFIFQVVFNLAAYPMDAIDAGTLWVRNWLSQNLPATILSDLLINGVIAGLSGVLTFIPQIMLLFGLITILEDTGYMARVSFMMDKLMRKVGLNGKSVVPLISGMACAVPAIMSTRTIENKKERLISLLVIPLMSCSARLPVYTLLVSLMVPQKFFLGFISLQGLIMLGLYFMGFAMALLVAFILKIAIKKREKS
jgi:ferrous iron transport protein B